MAENLCICWGWFLREGVENNCELNALLGLFLVLLALAHDGGTKSPAQVVRQFVELGVAINLDGFLSGIANHVAVVAPSQVVFQFRLGAIIQGAIQIIGQLLQELRAFHVLPSPLSRFWK